MKKDNKNLTRRILLGSLLLTLPVRGEEKEKRKIIDRKKKRSLVRFRILTSTGSAIHKANGIVVKIYYGNKDLLNRDLQFWVMGDLPQIASAKDREIDLVIEGGEDDKFSVIEIWHRDGD